MRACVLLCVWLLLRGEAQADVELRIDLQRQRMSVMVEGEALHQWPISSGRRGYETPTGTYRPYHLTPLHRSRKYDNAPMPHAIFFHGGYAIHATSATGRLGRPASHGCIRLSPSAARQLYSLVSDEGMRATRIFIERTQSREVRSKNKISLAQASPRLMPDPKPRASASLHRLKSQDPIRSASMRPAAPPALSAALVPLGLRGSL